MLKEICPEKALIFRIVHTDNLAWVLDHGMHCRNSAPKDSKYVEIGNLELIDKRHSRTVGLPPGGTLSDYVPFYFTPFSPMMYNIRTGFNGVKRRPNGEIAIMVSSLYKLEAENVRFLFTDRHAYLKAARFFSGLSSLDSIDWTILQNRDFKRDYDDLEKVERYQAEALVYKRVPTASLLGIVCYGDQERGMIKGLVDERGLSLRVLSKSGWYFQ